MSIKTKFPRSKTVKKRLTKQQKVDKLVREIEEARTEHKKGNFVRGNAEEVTKFIRSLIRANSTL